MPTKIEYVTESWNPVTGCTPVSEGCTHCYARRMAQRLKGRFGYPEDEPFRVTLHPDKLDQPLKWKKPRHIFVVSMGDLFHEAIPDHEINSIFLTMVDADWHTYLILTKRPARMADFVSIGTGWRSEMPHVWLGVTAENQQRADERIPILLQIPAAKRFVSIEPMLGPVDLTAVNVATRHKPLGKSEPFNINALTGDYCFGDDGDYEFGKLDWVVAGCESGPRRRPAKKSWFLDLKNQCVYAGVPFFLKQMAQGSQVVKMPYLDGKQWNQRP